MFLELRLMTFNKCEDCNMCCKLPEIPSVKKQSFKWCDSCNIGKSCKIYDDRPKECKEFYCAYILNLTKLKPNKCGFFIFTERKESYRDKVFTVYCEEHKLNNIPKKIMKDPQLRALVKDNWSFHIRYDRDDNNLAIFDLYTFGMIAKKLKRSEHETK